MSVARVPSTASVIDVLDRVLDKGIVIDAWVRVSLAGIDLITVEARVVVASIATYLTYASAISQWEPVSRYDGVIEPRPRTSLEVQLRRIREQMERHRFETQAHRRAEDRVRDELHDLHARTIAKR